MYTEQNEDENWRTVFVHSEKSKTKNQTLLFLEFYIFRI